MDDKAKGIDIFSPIVIFAFVSAFFGDVTFFLIVTHYICGLLVIGIFWHKARGILAKGILLIAFLLPGPFLTIGLVLAIVISNKIIALIVETVAIQVLAVATGGAAEGLEAGVIAEAGVETAEVAAEAGELLTEAGEAVEGGAEGAQNAAEEAASELPEGEPSENEEGENENKRPSEETEEKKEEREKKQKKRKKRREDEDENEEPDLQQDDDKETEEERKKREAAEDYEELTQTESEAPPIENMEKELFSERGPAPKQNNPRNAPPKPRTPDPRENAATRRLSERFEKAQKKAQETRRQLEKLKQPNQVDDDDSGDQDNNYLSEAA